MRRRRPEFQHGIGRLGWRSLTDFWRLSQILEAGAYRPNSPVSRDLEAHRRAF